MSAGSHCGCRSDSVYSCLQCYQSVRPECISLRPQYISNSEWSRYVKPEFRSNVEVEWQMMRRRDLEMYRQIMQSRDQLGSSLGRHCYNLPPELISSRGKRYAQVDEVGIQRKRNLKPVSQLEAKNAYDKRLEADLMARFKKQEEEEKANGTTEDVDLTLRMWFQEEKEGINEPNKKPKNE